MENELLAIYESRKKEFNDIVEKFPEAKMGGPFLMSPNDKYKNQKNPLLIIGRETHGWTSERGNLTKQMEKYIEFNLGIKYRPSPFWNVTRKVEKVIQNEPFSCAWTNFSKFDFYAGSSYGKYEVAISHVDNLLIDEIRVIKPKVCLFFTGPSFDQRIKKVFNKIEFSEIEGWRVRQLCQLNHPSLPMMTFRTYHPRSLRMQKLENRFINFIGSAVNG
jgi:hypothetical protein